MSAGRTAARIVCLGDIMVDVVAVLPGPLETGSDRPSAITFHAGGSAANTAAWLAHAGARAALIGCVGPDPFGDWSREQLGPGVELSVVSDSSLSTGTCIVLVGPEGERTMVPDAGANTALRPEDVPTHLFGPGGHLHVSGYALFGARVAAAVHAMTLARAAGATVSVGAASAAPLRALGAARFFELLGADALLVANRDEARVLTGQSEPETAARELGARTGAAIVTCGASGAYWSAADAPTVHSTSSTVDVVDTTGAGDAFIAGVLAATISGTEPPEMLRAGHDLAALACGRVGGRPVRPSSRHP